MHPIIAFEAFAGGDAPLEETMGRPLFQPLHVMYERGSQEVKNTPCKAVRSLDQSKLQEAGCDPINSLFEPWQN
jgi:hypothetical protein